MTSPHAFLMEFMKELVHAKNVDTRPQIVQQWTEKLEAREAELRQEFYNRFEAAMQGAQYCEKAPEKIPPQFLVVTASVFEAAREAAGMG